MFIQDWCDVASEGNSGIARRGGNQGQCQNWNYADEDLEFQGDALLFTSILQARE